jgi:hypothetical protein
VSFGLAMVGRIDVDVHASHVAVQKAAMFDRGNRRPRLYATRSRRSNSLRRQSTTCFENAKRLVELGVYYFLPGRPPPSHGHMGRVGRPKNIELNLVQRAQAAPRAPRSAFRVRARQRGTPQRHTLRSLDDQIRNQAVCREHKDPRRGHADATHTLHRPGFSAKVWSTELDDRVARIEHGMIW